MSLRSREDISDLSVDGVCEYLEQTDNIERQTVDVFRENRINGQSFLDLTDDDLRELVPRLGERKSIKRLVESFNPQHEHLRTTCTVGERIKVVSTCFTRIDNNHMGWCLCNTESFFQT